MVSPEESAEHGTRHFGGRLVLIIFFIAFGTASFGFSNSAIGSTLGQPSFNSTMGLDGPNGQALTSAILALFFGGGMFGAVSHGLLADRYGRKVSTACSCVIMIIGAAVCTGTSNVYVYIVFRFFCGWSSYQFLCTIPTWVTEITPPSHRGVLGNIIALNVGLGYVIASYSGVGFYFVKGNNQWRGVTGMQMIFPALLLAVIYWLPESPRYLVSRGRGQDALAILKSLHARAGHKTDHFAEIEYYQIQQQIDFDKDRKMSYIEIFRHPTMRKRALITICLTWCMVGSGVLVINNYGSVIYAQLGYGTLDTLLFLAGWVTVVMITPFICMTFIDRVSRTYVFASGFFLCMCTLIVEAALQKNYLGTGNKAGLAGAVAMTYLYVFFYVMFLDGPMFFYIGEIWPSQVRAQGFTIGITAMCICNLCWTAAAPTAFANIGWKYYIFFIVQAALGFVASVVWFPNTLGKPLEEIAALFGDTEDVVVFQRDLDESRFNDGTGIKLPPRADEVENLDTEK